MMDTLDKLFDAAPLLALFLTVAVGYLVGKLTIGRFVLGGIAGTLIVGVVVGQLDIHIDAGIKTVFFALFIYAVGFQGGPQFFRALNLKSLNELVSAFAMCLVGLVCVLAAAWLFGLDRGTAAGLAAGGLTQSAIIGTAGDAIARLDVSAAEIKQMQTNVAVGYAVCYIFGSLGPIIMVSWFFPTVMGWDVREEARKLAQRMSGGKAELEPGQYEAVRRVDTRIYTLAEGSAAIGQTVADADKAISGADIEAVTRAGKTLPAADVQALQAGDEIVVTGEIDDLHQARLFFGPEAPPPPGMSLVEENRDLVLTSPALAGRTIDDLHGELRSDNRRGAYLIGARRLGRDLPVLPDVELHKGDELILTGAPADLDKAQKLIGYRISAAAVTDFIFFGIGMALGMLIGLIQFRIAGIPVTIGTGGGCLLSGLLFGWLRSTHPRFAALPPGASNFLRDFGLAVFVGVVGLSAGPQAITTMQQHGLTLFLLGVGVTLIPQVVVFYFSYYVLRIRNPIEALGCLVGGRSANPGFAALLDKAGNATPVVPFTVTYAVANVFLTLWGPIIVGVIAVNP